MQATPFADAQEQVQVVNTVKHPLGWVASVTLYLEEAQEAQLNSDNGGAGCSP